MTTTNDAPAPAPSGNGVRISTGCFDKDNNELFVGDHVRHLLEGSHTKREYWNPEYEIIFEPPCYSLKHIGGGKDSGNYQFILRTGKCSMELLRRASLASDASPRSEAVRQWRWRYRNGIPEAWRDWKDGDPVVPFTEWNANLYDWETRVLYAHPAPATVEMREDTAGLVARLKGAHIWKRNPNPEAQSWGESHYVDETELRNLLNEAASALAALAPATELDSDTTDGQK